MNLLFIYLLLLLLFLRRYINESHNKQKQKRTLNLTIYCMHVSKSKYVNQFIVSLDTAYFAENKKLKTIKKNNNNKFIVHQRVTVDMPICTTIHVS